MELAESSATLFLMTSSGRDSRFPDAAWIRHHRQDLLRWFPPDVVASPKRLGLVVQEAVDFETGWCPEWLSDDDARTLLQFLHRHAVGPGWDLVNALERRRATTGRVLQASRQRRESNE